MSRYFIQLQREGLDVRDAQPEGTKEDTEDGKGWSTT